ncbi:FixH family protein [Methylotenera sp. L2L1]|uniref:FixH family protein n=1 Tax=Methylotenera sp. L2L1 TaxID=1502770 RepID=UPI000563807C|nr:FixH family protein [Methylotenera sp. L2L1]
MSTKQTSNEKAKWWKSGYAWLVFGGPAIVVVASLTTVYIAVNGQDPLLTRDENVGANTKSLTTAEKNALEPAIRARNHAATGVNDPEN